MKLKLSMELDLMGRLRLAAEDEAVDGVPEEGVVEAVEAVLLAELLPRRAHAVGKEITRALALGDLLCHGDDGLGIPARGEGRADDPRIDVTTLIPALSRAAGEGTSSPAR